MGLSWFALVWGYIKMAILIAEVWGTPFSDNPMYNIQQPLIIAQVLGFHALPVPQLTRVLQATC